MVRPDEILSFWFDEVGPKGWYKVVPEVDAQVSERFGEPWEQVRTGHGSWLTGPRSALAYVILTDQFPRNMFRGDPRSFATDVQARSAAKRAVRLGWDLRVDEPGRQFFYLPLMHSEILPDQEQCVRLMLTRLTQTGADNLLHARAHREVIRRFGRFPFRNEALGRRSTGSEAEFLASGSYGALVRKMSAAPAAE